ncbi:IPTL-CTERM sorting domain-containing protein [Thiothrix winogradskyi]|uniref:IPTL-CTERM sorting domain-containing protein n=1 Tax=Thiothrix winogradskyi TaxID=96472 RepID=A0ABY3STJ9_9GAMM|nr:IPTL-CTERM sorting domain-containing protein [Thiothrix winogradskyi]UJS22533.1 IPTL-CTERM sorting domain-containing protein [Thiothrix winogradskyi]
MKIIKLSLCISMVGAFATLPTAYANEVVTNCTQVVESGGSDSDATNNESCAAVSIPFDYGDAPDPTFPVLLANEGARHQLGTDVYLGKCVDGDSGALQGGGSADDADEGQSVYGVCATDEFGKKDDEDGVAIEPLHVGDTKSVVQVTASAACKLNAWVDWNQDGSWGGAGEQVFIDQVLSAGVNDLTMDVPAFAAEGTIYTRFRCSTAGADGIGGEAADGEVEDYALNILPAVPKTPVSVGDIIWDDTDKDGKQTAGENPLAGATVSLLDSTGAPAKDLTGTIVAEITTDATGKYLFDNLPEGDYSVKVTPPKDYIPSPSAGDVDTVPANDDSNCAVRGDGSITTELFTLTAGGEPVDDGDTDANSNLSVDCGFYKPTEPVYSLGNKVWIDDGADTPANVNNGTLDEGEAAVADGVVIELRNAEGALLTTTTTSKGFYLFSGLAAGDYKVCVAASNFATGSTLDGFSASTGGNETDANAGVDSNDNGSDVIAEGLCSNVITLDGNAPTGELDTASGVAGEDGVNTPDALSDLTVDFAVIPPKPAIPVSVGDTVWIDANENGKQDEGEAPLVGAVVTLLDKDGNPVKDLDGNNVDYIQTGVDGKYLFSDLPEGEYIVRVKAPDGYVVTQGGAAVDTDSANDDSNCAVVGGNVQTLPFMLTAGAEPVNDGDTDANSDLSVDCGFYQPKEPTHSIGNRVWIDTNNNGLADGGEMPASAGVSLDLKDANGTVIKSTTTDATGRYLFSGLAAGSYQVCVVADNFAAGNILEGFTASTGGNVADANTDIDGDDNGTDDIASGLCSNLVVLDDQEPTGENGVNDLPGVDGVNTDDNRSNLSVDFGIVAPVVAPKVVAVGDYLWIDANQDGKQNAGELPLAGATVTLLDKDGNPAKDVDGNAIAPFTTGADGLYGFTKLPEGDYSIRVQAPEGYMPTTNAGDVDEVVANDDSNCAVMGDHVQSAPFTLMAGTEPASGVDGDGDNSNLTVDCGFYQPSTAVHSIGNMVWVDDGAGDNTKADNGQFDEGETLLNGIKLELRDTTGAVLDSTMTAGGYYLFSGLSAGEYQVCVSANNFSGMGKLVGYTAGVNGKEADANTNGDSNDNAGAMTENGLCSNVIVLDDQEPTGELPTASGTAGDDSMGTEDSRSNLTVDFAVLPPAVAPKAVSVGDRIWIDTNEDGQQDEGETGLEGAVVTLLDKEGNPVTDLDGKPVAPKTTATDGMYLFENLPQGEYFVRVVAPEGYITTKGGAAVNDDPSNTDSNCQVVDGQTQTGAFNLTTDILTVDCGFYLPKAPMHSLGNAVWVDANNNGLFDKDEQPVVDGVVMELLDKDGKVMKYTETKNGYYLFSGLEAGEYQVCVAHGNFDEGLLKGYTPSTGGDEADVNTGTDNADNGDNNTQDGLCSEVIILDDKSPTGELPTASGTAGEDGMGTDDNRSNLTIDFGVIAPVAPKAVSVGDRIWIDTNEDGQQDEGETGLEGAVVTLLDKEGNPVTDLDGKPVAPKTTATDGMYLFENLPQGEYFVRVAAPEGYITTKGGTAVNDDPSNTDSNCQVVDGQTQTGAFNLTTDILTVDCGFYLPKAPMHSLGNAVWVDANNNGLFDKDEQPVVDGVVMELLDKSGNVMKYTETKNGYYLFSGLEAGEYQVCVAHGNFDEGLLKGYTPSTGGDEADVNTGTDNADNGDNDTQDGLCSEVIILDDKSPTGELPTASGTAGEDGMGTDDNRSNLTIDFGVIAPVAAKATVSGTVSVDTTGDSVGETPLEGILLSLLNKDGTPVLDKDGKPVTTLTNANGEYVFTDVEPGDYLVVETQPEGYDSVIDGDTTLPEDDAANTNTTDDSIPVSVTAGETDDGNNFVERAPVKPNTVSVGDYVWIDANENGQQDTGEAPLAGATVTLMDKDGKPVVLSGDMAIAPIVTGADGKYLFSNLPEGEYSISVAAPKDSGYLPTKGGAKVDSDPSNTDSNCSVDTGKTSLFTLTAGAEPDVEADGDGKDGNMTVDCGFYLPKTPTHSLGNMVWVDNGEGGNAGNGRFDAGETLPSNVVMELRDSTGALVNTTQTASGYYLFSGLTAGEYKVCVAGSNFNEGAALDGYTASTAAKEADANANGDNNDNGDSTASDGLCSNLIVLDDKEPTGEQPVASGIPGDDGMDTEDNRSNLTVDFAVVPVEPVDPGTPVSVGNQIWIDSNANGQREEGEGFLENAVVTLTDASGRPVTDVDGNTVAPHTTGADGLYLFDNLPEGEYIVTVEPPEGFFPTIGGIDVDADASDIDSNCRVNPVNTTIETHPFTLTAGAEPDADGDDANGNMTVDCGFYGSVSLGDKVWLDSNADGQQNNAEPGIGGVSVSLWEEDGITPATDATGKPVAAVMTDASGNYLFQNLKPGNYIVVMNPGKDSGYSLTKGGADPDTDPSNTDSNCKVVEGRFQTPAVTLTPGTEPNANGFSNLTVDCGLFRPVNLGSRLWLDLDGNGKQDGGEPGIPGATVTLLTVDGKPVTDVFGDVLKPQTTDADGKYFFGNLREGDYIVKVVPPVGYLPTLGGNDPNDDNATDSNGVLAPDGSIVSKPISLKWGDEPADGGATNTTVGFGLVANLHVPTLSQWGVMIMSMLLATAAFFRRRRED